MHSEEIRDSKLLTKEQHIFPTCLSDSAGSSFMMNENSSGECKHGSHWIFSELRNHPNGFFEGLNSPVHEFAHSIKLLVCVIKH